MRQALKMALAAVIKQHPMLRVGIAGENTANPVYVHLPAIDFQHVIEWKVVKGKDNDNDYTTYLLRSIEAQHDRLWEQLHHYPAWKIIVMQRPGIAALDIIFAFHHAIGDARSALIFHWDLQHALNGNLHPDGDISDSEMMLLNTPRDLPAPLEVIVPFTLTWFYFLTVIFFRIWSKLAPSWLRSTESPSMCPWTSKNVILQPSETHIRLVQVPDSIVASLVAACRVNRTTLTPLSMHSSWDHC